MGTEIAFGRSVVVGIDVQSIVRTSLHAGLATDATPVVEIDDSIEPPIQRTCGTDFRARWVIAVVAPHHAKMARSARKFALLDVLDPGAKDTDRDLMFLFARHRAGVTTDTAVLIDDKSVSHLSTFTLLRMPEKHFSFDIIADPPGGLL